MTMGKAENDSSFFVGVGPIAAVLLGMGLIPLRGLTTASNLTFVFLAVVIVVAELGGRWAAVATAISSALSLNFFLTQPYLTLTIHGRDDVIAVVGLAACGLIAASFGGRGKRMRAFAKAREEMDLLHATASQLELAGPLAPRLEKVLSEARAVFPVSALVVRDRHGRVFAGADRDAALRPVPQAPLALEAGRGTPFPAAGARVALIAANTQVGWLDVWGDDSRASGSTRRALGDFGRLLAALVAGNETRT
jgi:hypothetical protein